MWAVDLAAAADGSPASLRDGEDELAAAARALAEGSVLAVKGIGGFHLACDAASERAVAALRARKRREDRPFAVMVASLQAARALARVAPAEQALLQGPQRPIVLVAPRDGAPVAASVAAGAAELGLMLAYSPLHHLLLRDFEQAGGTGGLVLTSGNVSDEPIAYQDEDALERLAGVADLILTHDRPIETRTDDSVVRVLAAESGARPLFIRRSRGYVPAEVSLPDVAERPILACGAELKNTFCVVTGSRAVVSHHIGDLENFQTLCSFTDGVEHFKRLFEIEPEIVAHDLHPEYLSTKYALELDGVRLLGVQHHHAHLAACLAEHGERGVAVGAIFDGTGYGPDGTVWGASCWPGASVAFDASACLGRSGCPAAQPRSASRGAWPARGWPRRAKQPSAPGCSPIASTAIVGCR